MKYTSAEANKYLRKLHDELCTLEALEAHGKEFLAAVGESVESARPDYDFMSTQKRILEICATIRKVKHAVNVFNITTVLPSLKITVDEALVLLPQLNRRISELLDMLQRLPKVREQYSGKTSSVIDYRYINYDLEQVRAEYARLTDLLDKTQTELDTVNNTLTFEI